MEDNDDNLIMIKKRRGRPLGFRLTENSKLAISNSKLGQHHSQETRDKISKSLSIYFRNLHPLTDELLATYCKYGNAELKEWLLKFKDELDSLSLTNTVMTEKALTNVSRIEISYGHNVSLISLSSNMTPEELYELEEVFEEDVKQLGYLNDMTPDELLELKETCLELGIVFDDILRKSI